MRDFIELTDHDKRQISELLLAFNNRMPRGMSLSFEWRSHDLLNVEPENLLVIHLAFERKDSADPFIYTCSVSPFNLKMVTEGYGSYLRRLVMNMILEVFKELTKIEVEPGDTAP